MADAEDGTRDTTENNLPPAEPLLPTPNAPLMAPPFPPYAPYPPYPPMPLPLSRRPSALERWRGPLIAALVGIVIAFSVLDVFSLFSRPTQSSSATRPLVINAQIVNGATPSAHPDLGLAPAALTVACGKSGRIVVSNQSSRPLQWFVTTSDSAITLSTNSPRSGLLGPGASVTLTVLAFSQPGAYQLHFTDDHDEVADVTIQVTC